MKYFTALLCTLTIFTIPVHSQPIVSAPTLDGGLAIIRIHLMENAPDTIFTIKPKKTWGISPTANAKLLVKMDTLLFAQTGTSASVSKAMLAITQTINNLDPKDYARRDTFRVGEIIGYPYPGDGIMLYLECLSITKTQSRFREYKLALPLFPDSIAIIPRQRSSGPQQLQRAAGQSTPKKK